MRTITLDIKGDEPKEVIEKKLLEFQEKSFRRCKVGWTCGPECRRQDNP